MAVSRACAPWCEPLDALAAVADAPFAFALLSDGAAGRWSYVGSDPVRTFDSFAGLRAALGAPAPAEPEGPPFQGGAVGMASFEWGATLEPSAPQARRGPWPDLVGGVYEAVLAFDHRERRVWTVGRGADAAAAERARGGAGAQLAMARTPRSHARPPPDRSGEPAFKPTLPRDYPSAVADVVRAIGEGEVFQANIARAWAGSLAQGSTPFDLLERLMALSPAPFAGYLRLPGLAIVSNSPERFLNVEGRRASTRPIKGTRPRGVGPAADGALAAELLASAKDRAENRMIVDLMRNDLSRACTPGTVGVDAFCALESFANVHHLVSTVSGRLAPGRDALDLFAAAFPPGSVVGAPKLQALQVIARHEPPRGAYCGSLFYAGADGGFDSNVLIRTVGFEAEADGWRWETRAGAGITADSDPHEEDAEAVAKIAAIHAAICG